MYCRLMPGKNLQRNFTEHGYYHVYNRGIDKQKIFLDAQDYKYFTSLFSRHLSKKLQSDRYGRDYKWLRPKVDILAYCWMPSHFHLLVYQKEDPRALVELMSSIGTAYTMYFNKKYKRRGPLFESNYRASLILDDSYFAHISRYIHLNPSDYKNWHYSSLSQYLGKASEEWVEPSYIANDFTPKEYEEFVDDYLDVKNELDLLKHELADQ